MSNAYKRLLLGELLVPVTEIAQMALRPKRFLFEESKTFLESQGRNIADFYYHRYTPFSWFAYYRDFVLIDIPAFNIKTLKAMNIAEAIDFETSRLKNCLDKGDFVSFFSLIDKRIALETYLRLFPAIPNEQKYYLFWYIFSRCHLRLEDFSEAFIRNIKTYQTADLKLPADEQGYIDVYRGHGLSSPVTNAWSWTYEINAAIYFAYDYQGKVYRGKIHSDNVIASIKYRNEKEIICFPGAVKEIKEMKFKSLADIKPELEYAGVMKLYEKYSSMLKDKYFHRPRGIHGLSHTRRVLLLSLIIAWMENLAEEDWELLGLAALYHDIGRCNDNFDPRHGYESYNKAVSLDLITFPCKEREMLRFIIENHCVNDQKAEAIINQYDVADNNHLLTLFKVFKDADGLDRIRINDLDINQLRTPSAPQLLYIARELLEQGLGIA